MLALLSALSLVAAGAQATSGVAAPSLSAGKEATDTRQKVVCKRFTETGSLVRSYKTCKTNAEWQRERDNIRQNRDVANSCRALANGGAC